MLPSSSTRKNISMRAAVLFEIVTPLLWLLFVVNLMGYFFLVSWTPLLLTSAHMPLSKAALAQTLFQLGGAAGGWVLCRP
jgi:hypothetical protein